MYTYDGIDYRVRLIDDGTMDTVISVNGVWYRFDSEYARDVDGDVSEDTITEAIEAYLEDMEEK